MRIKKDKNQDYENYFYEMNLAFARNARERREVKRMFDRNLFNSKVVNALNALVLTAGLAVGTYQAHNNELSYPIYENAGQENNLDGILTIMPW